MLHNIKIGNFFYFLSFRVHYFFYLDNFWQKDAIVVGDHLEVIGIIAVHSSLINNNTHNNYN